MSDYRRNHQSIQVQFEQNSPDWIHVLLLFEKQLSKHVCPFARREIKTKNFCRNVWISVDLVVTAGSQETSRSPLPNGLLFAQVRQVQYGRFYGRIVT